MKPDDRSIILRRRALYVGGSLALLSSCARSGGEAHEPEPPSTSVVVPSVDESDAGVVMDAAPPGRGASSQRPGMPSLEIPDGVSETARRNYERLLSTITAAHDLIDEIEAALPAGCSVTDKNCEPSWRVVADKRDQLNEKFRFAHYCKGSSADAKAFAEREREHRTFYEQRLAALDQLVKQTVAGAGPNGETEWSRIQRDVRRGKPRVCLSFACVDW